MHTSFQKLRLLIQWMIEPLTFFILLLTCLPILFTGLYMGIHDDNLPRFDEQRNLRLAIAIDEGTFQLSDLFYNAAGHYTVPTNVMTALLIKTSNWNLNYAMWSNMLLALVCFGLFLLLFYHTRLPLLLFILPLSLLLFAPMQDISWLVGYQGAWRFADTFMLIGLCLLVYYPNRWQSLLGAAFCALLATFSVGSGFLSWAVMGGALLLGGNRNWRQLTFWIALSLFITLFYIRISRVEVAANTSGSGTATTLSLANPLQYLEFMFAYLGNNFGRNVNLAKWFGLMGGVLLALNTWAIKEQRRILMIWLPLTGYSAATGLLVGLSRLESRGMIRALTSWYYASTAIFWIAFVALLIALIVHWQQRRTAWLQTLITANLIFSAVLVGFFINKNHFEVQEKQNLGTQAVTEVCGETYILRMDDRCLAQYIYARASTLDQLAARKLAMYATLKPAYILPETYQAGEPLVIETASIWWNIHVQDWQLSEVPHQDMLHIYPPDPLAEVPHIPLPALAADETEKLETWLGDHGSFWRLVTLDAPGYYNEFFDSLQSQGFGKDFTLFYDKLLVIHYRRIDNAEAEVIHFGDALQVRQWLVDGNLAPCESIWLHTIWSANTVPDHNYNLRLRLISGQGEVVSTIDQPLGHVPTQLWYPNDLYLDERPLTLPCNVPPGEYHLELRVYTSAGADWLNLSATSPAGDNLGDAPTLTKIVIGS